MGNTCGSCSFDNRGSEFDMESKDKYVGPPPIKEHQPVKITENESNHSNSLVPTQKQLYSSKSASVTRHINYDVEDKENVSMFQNNLIEEHIIEEKILDGK